jgi:hypothetical protein
MIKEKMLMFLETISLIPEKDFINDSVELTRSELLNQNLCQLIKREDTMSELALEIIQSSLLTRTKVELIKALSQIEHGPLNETVASKLLDPINNGKNQYLLLFLSLFTFSNFGYSLLLKELPKIDIRNQPILLESLLKNPKTPIRIMNQLINPCLEHIHSDEIILTFFKNDHLQNDDIIFILDFFELYTPDCRKSILKEMISILFQKPLKANIINQIIYRLSSHDYPSTTILKTHENYDPRDTVYKKTTLNFCKNNRMNYLIDLIIEANREYRLYNHRNRFQTEWLDIKKYLNLFLLDTELTQEELNELLMSSMPLSYPFTMHLKGLYESIVSYASQYPSLNETSLNKLKQSILSKDPKGCLLLAFKVESNEVCKEIYQLVKEHKLENFFINNCFLPRKYLLKIINTYSIDGFNDTNVLFKILNFKGLSNKDLYPLILSVNLNLFFNNSSLRLQHYKDISMKLYKVISRIRDINVLYGLEHKYSTNPVIIHIIKNNKYYNNNYALLLLSKMRSAS